MTWPQENNGHHRRAERVFSLPPRLFHSSLHPSSPSPQVWLSFARFEAAPLPAPEGAEDGAEPPEDEPPESRQRAARSVFERAHQSLKEGSPDAKEERVMLLEAWRAFELESGSGPAAAAAVEKKLPRRVKKRRQLLSADGTPAGQEEYFDYIFPVRIVEQAPEQMFEEPRRGIFWGSAAFSALSEAMISDSSCG